MSNRGWVIETSIRFSPNSEHGRKVKSILSDLSLLCDLLDRSDLCKEIGVDIDKLREAIVTRLKMLGIDASTRIEKCVIVYMLDRYRPDMYCARIYVR